MLGGDTRDIAEPTYKTFNQLLDKNPTAYKTFNQLLDKNQTAYKTFFKLLDFLQITRGKYPAIFILYIYIYINIFL